MRQKFLSAVAGASLVLVLATGCQATPPDIAPSQATSFQSRVLAVTTAVADGGYAAALETLTALEAELDAAAAEGTVSFARHQRIEAAIAAVRTDIQAAIDAQAEPEPEPEPEPVEPTAPEEEVVTPDVETDAERKAREAEEKAAEDAAKKAAEEKKKADEAAAKAAEEARKKAEEEQKKQAEEDAENNGEDPGNNSGNETDGDD